MNDSKGNSFWVVEVYDRSGKLIEVKKGVGNCILSNFIGLIEAIRLGASTWEPTDVNGTQVSISNINIKGCRMWANEGEDNVGIIVGSGSTEVTLDDHNLASKIPNGTGANQLSYGACNMYDYDNGLQQDRGVKRSFTNNSGSSITINEIGLVMKVNDGTNDYYILIMRDVISATTVPDGGVVTVTYYIRFNG